jgi:tRNA(fMet)-specific endonuclease VapC
MESLILLDTSVLIEYFRKKTREESLFVKLAAISNNFCISVITHFEISCGIDLNQEQFWKNIFSDIIHIPYNVSLNNTAVAIYQQSKRKRATVEFRDLIIASTAIQFGYQLATLNKKHFEHIQDLSLITHSSF